jgi:hypothetical protein
MSRSSDSADRDFLAVLALPLLGLACCLGLPLLLPALLAIAVWLISGPAAAVALALAAAAVVAVGWRRGRAIRRTQSTSPSHPSVGPGTPVAGRDPERRLTHEA